IHRLTNGVPRLINSVCDHTLSTGFRRQQKKVGADFVLEAAEEMGLEQPAPVTVESNANPLAGLAKTAS
ncbi:MAG: ExeA family protein, partial [Candidatus Angelobacter sp.]